MKFNRIFASVLAVTAVGASIPAVSVNMPRISITANAFDDTLLRENKQEESPLIIVEGILVDGHTCLGNVFIPEGVTAIGDWTFSDCSGLTSITIPDSVTNICYRAFYKCSGLTSITILNPDCEILDSKDTITNGYNNDYYFNGTIYGYYNSTAHTYAEKYGYKFQSIGGAAPEIAFGDVNGDNSVDSSDATNVLVDYSLISTGKESQLTDAQKAAADIDKDGKIDSSDASFILQYYAYSSTGGKETDMSKWMNSVN